MNEAIQFMHDYSDFTDPNHIWVMVGLSRNKDNEPTPSIHNTPERFMRRLVLISPDDIDTCYRELHLMGNKIGTKYRIYMSLNSRDIIKATFNFQKKMVDLGSGLANNHPDALTMVKKVHSLWKTELAQKHNRGTKRILLDIDDNDEEIAMGLLSMVQKATTKVHTFRQTVSGYAISFEACDTRDLTAYIKTNKIDADMQRDSLIFVEQWEGTRDEKGLDFSGKS